MPGPTDDIRLQFEEAIDRGEVNRALRRLVERLGHVFRRHRRDHWQTRARRCNRHEPGAGTHGAERRQVGRTGAAHRTGDDEHATEIAFV